MNSGNATLIKVQYDDVGASEKEFKALSAYFKAKTVINNAKSTTITANSNLDSSFEDDQHWVEKLGSLIDFEAKNINNISVNFKEYDELIATFTN